MYILGMTMMTVSEARAALPEVLDRVAGGEEVTITRHGRPVAVVIRPDILWARRADGALDDADRIHALLTEAAAAPLFSDTEPAGTSLTAEGLTTGRAEELIAAIRAGRDDR
jgi:antitoxin (DNA-binding transcriptional repressor) of toxin-antitoxin stability system